MFKRINKIIKIFIVSDFVFQSGWGLLAPVFAIFILQRVAFGSSAEAAKIAGFASLTYWLVKSFLQIPIARYLDKNHGERDDFYFMVFGTFLAGIVSFGFVFVRATWHIYALQCLLAFAMAMLVPSWAAIFTRHIDKDMEAFEWGTRSTTLGIGVGVGGAVGGLLAALFGFTIIFIMVGVLTMLSAGLLFLVRKEIAPKDNNPAHRLFPFKFPFIH